MIAGPVRTQVMVGTICKAWALVNGATGAVLKGSNVAMTRTAVGTYTVTFTQAMATANYLYDFFPEPDMTNSTNAQAMQMDGTTLKAATGFTLKTYDGGVLADMTPFYLAVYE